ncbi:hypothetical protein Q5P01_002997 [Channa striata]|uniref:Ig-like domain-containing protein n=1 Tax=Channa striata TaxID=64152 RepID=A0AA88T8M5_CHASR|nr:hypothetical protein Q5P01_002997 [Channa striata]
MTGCSRHKFAEKDMLCICRTSAHSRASVTVTPNRSQHFEYDQVSVSCEHFGSGEWTVWRYTIKDLKLSQCGSGWGSQISSTCVMKTTKMSASGVYWCESEHRDSSNAVNITVTGNEVILHSPAVPVMEGQHVTLECKTRNHVSSSTAVFYKNNTIINTEPTGHVAIYHFSKSDEGAYKCSIDGHGESPFSWLLMKDDSDPVSLIPSPDSSQRLEYENLSLSCGDNSINRGWKVTRSTTSGSKMSSCGDSWGTPTKFGCLLDTAKQPDSAVYWCESPAKQRSNSVNITIYDTPVILQSPVLPVTEAEKVILHCRVKDSSELPADFYKDGSLIRTEPTGHMTIHHVTKSDEGVYKCHISGRGESPPSRLLVRRAAQSPSPATDPTAPTLTTIRHIVVCSPYLICTLLLFSIYRQRPTVRSVPMTTCLPNENNEEVEPQYEDVIANVTTEHQF